jgi:hypothetical protein
LSRRKVSLAVAVVIVAAGSLFFWERNRDSQSDGESPLVEEALPSGPRANGGVQTSEPIVRQGSEGETLDGRKPYDTGIRNDPRVQHTDEGNHVFLESIAIADGMGDVEESPEQDLEKLSNVLSFYRMAFEENPVAADNASVMAALMGDNPKSLVFFSEKHPSLNAQGELMDRWGTPYYFHALSGKQMEIVSPGSDKLLGTDDDMIHTQRDGDQFFRGYTEAPPDQVGEE